MVRIFFFFLDETEIAAKVVLMDLKHLPNLPMLEYKAPQTIQKNLVSCDGCDHVSSETLCNVGVVTDMDPSRYGIKVSYSLIEKKLDLVRDKDIVPKLINKKFLVTIDKTNRCVKFADCYMNYCLKR